MATSIIRSDVRVEGHLSATSMTIPDNSVNNSKIPSDAAIARSKLAQDTFKPYVVPLTDFRVHDALQTVLPGTSANDDLALDGGTFGTSAPTLRTGDVKTATVTRYARALIRLPAEFDDGESVTLRLVAGMLTTVADTSATVDVECYAVDKEGSIGSDLCSTSAKSINSLTFADQDFTIDGSGLVAGDWLDVRITVAVTDSATATAVIAAIASVELLCDVRG